jgi:hypothetical protein
VHGWVTLAAAVLLEPPDGFGGVGVGMPIFQFS